MQYEVVQKKYYAMFDVMKLFYSDMLYMMNVLKKYDIMFKLL